MWVQGPDTRCCWGGCWPPSLTGLLLPSICLGLFMQVFHAKRSFNIEIKVFFVFLFFCFLSAGIWRINQLFLCFLCSVYLFLIFLMYQEHSGQQLRDRHSLVHQWPEPQAPGQQSAPCSQMWAYMFCLSVGVCPQACKQFVHVLMEGNVHAFTLHAHTVYLHCKQSRIIIVAELMS